MDTAKQHLSIQPTQDQLSYFDRIYAASSEKRLLKRDSIMYHGWTYIKPTIHNNGALFVTPDFKTAKEYLAFARPINVEGGIIVLRLNKDIEVNVVSLTGGDFISVFKLPPEHSSFAYRLHGWAKIRKINALYEGAKQYVVFEPLTLFDVIGDAEI